MSYGFYIVSILLLWALPARADVAIPLVDIVFGSGTTIPLLLGVILLETLIVWFTFAHKTSYSFLQVLGQLALMNGVTTLIGYFFVFGDVRETQLESVFKLMFVLTLLIETAIFYYFYSPSKSEQKVPAILGSGLLANLTSYALLFALLYNTYEYTPRRPLLKGSMHSLQTMVETYAVDWGGLYAPTIEALETEAKEPGKSYWRAIEIPGTKRFYQKKSPGQSLLLRSNEQSRPYSIRYSPLLMPKHDDRAYGYQIVAYGRDGKLLTQKEKVFTLHSDTFFESTLLHDGVYLELSDIKKWSTKPPYLSQKLPIEGRLRAVNESFLVVATFKENKQGQLDVWNRKTMKKIQTLTGVNIWADNYYLSANAHWLVIADRNQPLLIWDVKANKERMRFKNLNAAQAVISSDEQLLILSSTDRGIQIWDLEQDVPQYNWDFDFKNHLAIHGHKLAFGSYKEPLQVWDVRHPREPKLFFKTKASQAGVIAVAFSKKGQYIAAAYNNGQVVVYHGNGNMHSTFKGRPNIQQLAFVEEDTALVAMYHSPDPRTFDRWVLK